MGTTYSNPPSVEGRYYRHFKQDIFKQRIIEFNFASFQNEMNRAANLRKIGLVWRLLTHEGPNGDGTGMWRRKINIRNRFQEFGFDREVKPALEIIDQIIGLNQIQPGNLFCVHLRQIPASMACGWEDQVLFVNGTGEFLFLEEVTKEDEEGEVVKMEEADEKHAECRQTLSDAEEHQAQEESVVMHESPMDEMDLQSTTQTHHQTTSVVTAVAANCTLQPTRIDIPFAIPIVMPCGELTTKQDKKSDSLMTTRQQKRPKRNSRSAQ